jgi:uncharacterized protein (TIGR00255 family)
MNGILNANLFEEYAQMIQSMTAFANVKTQLNSDVALSWELRSLNHRYLDISFRLPESLRHLEPSLRQCLHTSFRGKISRGKFDFCLKISGKLLNQSTITVNETLVRDVIHHAKHLAATYGLADNIQLSHVLSWQGVLEQVQPDFDEVGEPVERLLKEGVEKLLQGRRAEGDVLQKEILLRVDKLRHEIMAVREQTASLLTSARQKLLKRVDELQIKIADSRLEQELALLLVRLDVSEEIDRLCAHVDEVVRVMKQDEASGKRLDFLMQELNREANTLSSKSDSAELTQRAVQIKVLIEQMREQIQNIE